MTAAHGPSTVAAVLVAAGSGQRLGSAVPKAFAEVAGHTLLELAVRRFGAHPQIGGVVVVAPQAHLDDARAVAATSNVADVVVVAGGVTRQASVFVGLAALARDVEFVLVHDVARPFVPLEVISRVLAALSDGADAAIPVLPLHDTIRRVDAAGALAGVVDRSELVGVQTPQGFRRDALLEAHAAGERLQVTDDAALVEAQGGTVVGVPGADELFKITRPWDLAVAGAMYAAGALDA